MSVVRVVLLCTLLTALLGGCTGGSDTTGAASDGLPETPLAADRTIPVQGQVDGATAAELAPGVNASVSRTEDDLAVRVDRDSVILQIDATGQRSEVATLAASESASLPAPEGDGVAVYYEAEPLAGGNKVVMGAGAPPEGLLPAPIIFIRMNAIENPNRTPFMAFRNLGIWMFEEQAIMRLDPDGTLTQVLAITNRPMQDLEVSYDATKLAFTMREFGGDDMELFEVNIDGTNLTQLTFNEYDDAEPTYLPDGRILFTSERLGIGDFYDSGTEVPQMYVLDPFTGEERLVHIAMDGCFNPIVRHNGELLFVSWDTRINIAGPHFNRFVVWKMNPDGTDAFPVFGSHIARDFADCFVDVRETFDNQLLCVHTNFDLPQGGRAHHENFGAGAVLKVDPDGNPDFPSYRYLTDSAVVDSGAANTLGRYKFPIALPDGNVLVSYAPGKVWSDGTGDKPDWGIHHLDASSGELTPVLNAEGVAEFGAVLLLPRQAPPIIPDSTLHKEEFGEFACGSIFNRQGDMRQHHPKPEEGPWKLRVIQVLKSYGVPNGDTDNPSFDHGNFPHMIEGPMIGEYPVAPDGSFRIRIPANTPITWELVDGTGRVAVRERMFNIVRPGEVRTCAGCHGRIDRSEPIPFSAQAFQDNGAGFHDLRGLFEDFETTVLDNTMEH